MSDSARGFKIFTVDEFAEMVRSGARPQDALVRAPFAAEVKAEDGESKLVTFTITTEAPDRERDVISRDGWELSAFLKNPVILWAHSYDELPIARARSITKTEKGLRAVADFTDSAKMDEFAAKVHAYIRAGLLNATSVGFRPLKYAYNEERRGVDFMEQELLEFSVVPVPSNPQALVEQRAASRNRAARNLLRGGVISCPRGDQCPNATNTIDCPAGKDCPIVGHALASASPLAKFRGDQTVLEIIETPAPRGGFEFAPDTLREALSEVIGASVQRSLNRHLGRID
jgi:HK97 family phage prohead protease